MNDELLSDNTWDSYIKAIEIEGERQKKQDEQSRIFWSDAIKYKCKADSAYTRAGESYLAKEIQGDIWRILLPIPGGDVVIPGWLFREAFGFSFPVEGEQ